MTGTPTNIKSSLHAVHYILLFLVLANHGSEPERCKTLLSGSFLEIGTLVNYNPLYGYALIAYICVLVRVSPLYRLLSTNAYTPLFFPATLVSREVALSYLGKFFYERRDERSSWILVSWDRDRSVHDRGHTVHQRRCPSSSGRE